MKLTIITATRNSAHTIDRCQASLDNVTPADGISIEKLVIDGGSSDGTLELLHGKFADVRIVRQTGKGLYQALNEGVESATGDYVMFVHSDDEVGGVDLRNISLDPDRVFYGGVEFIDWDGNVLYRRRAPRFFKNCLSQFPFVFHPNAIYPRRLLLKYPFDGPRYGLAADMWQINAFRNEVEFVATPAISYRFRVHAESSTVRERARLPWVFWLWRVYVFLLFEDRRVDRMLGFFRGKRSWSVLKTAA